MICSYQRPYSALAGSRVGRWHSGSTSDCHAGGPGSFPVRPVTVRFGICTCVLSLHPSSGPRLVYQRLWHVLSCLCDNACKRSRVTYGNRWLVSLCPYMASIVLKRDVNMNRIESNIRVLHNDKAQTMSYTTHVLHNEKNTMHLLHDDNVHNALHKHLCVTKWQSIHLFHNSVGTQ